LTASSGSPAPGQAPAIWGAVPQRNKNFTGRQELLAELRQRLEDQDKEAAVVLPHAMHGMGGVGKTQLAIEYAHRYAGRYQAVWWIPADQPGLIRSTLAGLAPHLELTGLAPGRVEDAVTAVLQALRRGTPVDSWLLIFDNADEPQQIRHFMPSARGGHIIVTSRNRRWEQIADTIEVDVFSRPESQQFLERRNPGIMPAEANQLAEALGDLPLALEHAASLMTEIAMTPAMYLEIFEEEHSRILGEKPSTSEYPLPVAATWSVSVTRLREQTPDAMELLQRCAFFGASPISLELLERGKNVLGRPMQDILRDPIVLGRAVRALGRYGLARIDNFRRTLEVHRIIQRILRDELNPDEADKLRHEVHLLMAAANPGEPDNVENWPKYEELIAHLDASKVISSQNSEARQLIQDIVRYLYRTGNYGDALNRANEALATWGKESDEDDRYILVMNRLKTQILRGLARYQESFEITTRVMPRMQAVLGEDHDETLILMNGHCVDLRVLGQFKESLEFTKETLERHRAVFGPEHPRTIVAMNNLAEDHELNGEYEEARNLNQQVYDEKKRFYSADDPTVLYTLNALARTMREQGNFQEALPLAEQAYAGYQGVIERKLLTTAHPWILQQMVDLAVAWRAAGLTDQSLSLARRAYDHYLGAFGRDHTATLAAAICLAHAERDSGDLAVAEKRLAETLNGYKSVLGPGHPYTMCCQVDLAVVKRGQEDTEPARRLLADARDKLTELFGPAHHGSLAAAADLASALAQLGDLDGAIQLEEQALPLFESALGPSHPATLACTWNLAQDLQAADPTERSARLAKETMAQLERVLGREHLDITSAHDGKRLDVSLDPTATF
jgi:tetratricopeptide (TPR) repeat protein